ncbi:MAG: TonB-denpendent receptor [Rariglobus sp.]|jgi:outer membrane receptor protein involved in Fe transport|nr:TonB-denpendent receptor [Rariglobus sp.]
MRFKPLLFLPVTACALFAGDPPVALSPVVVSATRSEQPAQALPVAVTVFTVEDLRASPSLAIDDTLRSDPSFSLFRRTGSLTANPTAQGVSLRGLGPSGASRSLVLLDGIPLNDPFGGWVAWTKLPKLSLSSAEIVRGGGSGAWGNAALGGTVQLLTAPPDGNHAAAEAYIGDFDTRGGEVAITRSTAGNRTSVTVDAAAFATDGVYLIRNPGSIDRPASLDYQRAQASICSAITDTLTLTVTGRLYAEERGNGTPLQRNSSDEAFFSVVLSGYDTQDFTWAAVFYAQDQSFASFFSSVDPTRTTETPANDQYDVPATALGATFTATWTSGSGAITTLGTDFRRVEGETRERFNFALGPFDRRAGGEQTFLGLFARHDRSVLTALHVSAGARIDTWQNTGGFRRETGPVPLDQTFPDQEGVEFSPHLGLVWQPAPDVRARASAYQAFRVPTLNEYYRPFRVGAVTTNANPDLVPETLTGFETGLDLGRPGAPLGASLTAFVNELQDAVANVTIAPDTRERRNLDHVRVQGLEASLRARPHRTLTLEAAYLFTDARVTDPGANAPASLDGNRLAQVPRHTLTTSATWNAPFALQLTARARWFSAQYEDDENTLRLAPAATVDLGVSRRFRKHWEVFVAVENLFDAEVETGRTTAGIVSIAPPRWSRAGLRYDW